MDYIPTGGTRESQMSKLQNYLYNYDTLLNETIDEIKEKKLNHI